MRRERSSSWDAALGRNDPGSSPAPSCGPSGYQVTDPMRPVWGSAEKAADFVGVHPVPDHSERGVNSPRLCHALEPSQSYRRFVRREPESGRQGMRRCNHDSLISLDGADILSDTRFRGHSRFSAEGIAVPLPGSNATRPFAYAAGRAGSGLKNRKDRTLTDIRFTLPLAASPPVRFDGLSAVVVSLWLSPVDDASRHVDPSRAHIQVAPPADGSAFER
jgi:hypothetical protein